MQAIDSALLLRLCTTADAALVVALAPEMTSQFPHAGFDTVLRVSHFLGQVAVETWAFSRMSENLDYSAFRIGTIWPALKERSAALAANPEALADAAYANRWGNGDEASGDGWRYRGRGLFQHTFKDNYAELQKHLGLPFLSNPDLLLQAGPAVRAGIYFFCSRGCLELADKDDCTSITKKVTGSSTGLVQRQKMKEAAFALLNT